jgi:hypothetical protein
MAFRINGVDVKVSDSEKLNGATESATATDNTIAKRDSSGRLEAAAGVAENDLVNFGQFGANSALVKTSLNAGGSAPIYACRAWVNFNGTGTVAIRASGNVSSITDNGTGKYTVNFTTAMPDANYTAPLTSSNWSGSASNVDARVGLNGLTVTSIRVTSAAMVSGGGIFYDPEYFSVTIFR